MSPSTVYSGLYPIYEQRPLDAPCGASMTVTTLVESEHVLQLSYVKFLNGK